MTAGQPDAGPQERPVLRVVRGHPTAEELAALVAVIAGRPSAGAPAAPAPVSVWASRAAQLRRPLPHGPGAWRASGLPGA